MKKNFFMLCAVLAIGTLCFTDPAPAGQTIVIDGDVDSDVYGNGDNPGGDAFTGNTLNVWNYTGSSVASVQNFEFYNFVLPASLTGLKIADGGTAYLNDQGGKGSTVTGVSVLGGVVPPRPGAKVNLIDAYRGTLDTNGFTQTKTTGKHGATLLYDWTLDTANNQLIATVAGVKADPRAKVLSEGFIIGAALLNQGADLTAGAGLENALNADTANAADGWGSFAALSGGWSRYSTGSHVDMSSVSLMAGLSRGFDTSRGRAAFGAFFEYGSGSYDTNNSFSGAAVNGNGDADYLGGGLMGRMDFNGTGADPYAGHFYSEGSVRTGRVSNEFDSGGHLFDALGQSAGGYEISSPYFGLHFGAGYVRSLSESTSLDLYGKFFWTRLGGDCVTLSTNDPVTFDYADSHRLRLGARFAHNVNERVGTYFGAAWEHEFDGEAGASTYGYSIDAPSLEGDTGIGEIGLTVKPSPDKPLTMDLGVQGYAGAREGVTGSLRVKWEF